MSSHNILINIHAYFPGPLPHQLYNETRNMCTCMRFSIVFFFNLWHERKGWNDWLNHSHDFHSRKQFIGESGVYGGRAVRREVSFRTCGRQDGGTAVYGGGSIL